MKEKRKSIHKEQQKQEKYDWLDKCLFIYQYKYEHENKSGNSKKRKRPREHSNSGITNTVYSQIDIFCKIYYTYKNY